MTFYTTQTTFSLTVKREVIHHVYYFQGPPDNKYTNTLILLSVILIYTLFVRR